MSVPAPEAMKRTTALLHMLVVLGIIGFSTYELFQGNMAAAMAAFPLLVVYYLFITARRQKG